jgi:hypothetical protein
VFGVLRAICTVVGAVVLYCAVIAALWYGLIHAGRRRGRRHAERRAAASRAVPVVQSAAAGERDRPARSSEELPSWLWRDRPWAVAVVLLGAPSVRDRTAPFVDFSNRAIAWTALLEESRAWPPDQRLLVQSAYELSRQIRHGRLEPEDGMTTLS